MMIRAEVMYPRSRGVRFDYDYYVNEHLDMAKERLVPSGLISVEIWRGIAGEPVPSFVIGCFTFDSLTSYQRAMGDNLDELTEDIKQYTDVEPLVQVSALGHRIDFGATTEAKMAS